MATRMTRRPPLLAFLLAAAALPRCSCDDGQQLGPVPVEMRLTLLEQDPCSGAGVARRIPDDYEAQSIAQVSDFGAVNERRFEVRSIGTAPLSISEVKLSAEDPEFTLELLDANGNPASLPMSIPANANLQAPPGLVISVKFQAQDAEPDLLDLLITTDDPKRKDLAFGLATGQGKLQICGTNGCEPETSQPAIQFGDVRKGESATEQLVLKNVGQGDLDLRSIKLDSGTFEFCAQEATEIPSRPSNAPACELMNLCRVLKPGESYTVNVRYDPFDAGEDTGYVRIVSSDVTKGTVDVPINGTGAGPALCVCVVDGSSCIRTSVVDFGFVDVAASEPRTVRLESCGTEAVNLTEAVLETTIQPYVTGPEFQITTAFPTGSIPRGEFSEGVITFRPTAAGTSRGGLRYATEGGANRSWVALTGAASTCDLDVLPSRVQFGVVASGSNVDRTVLITNNGARDCNVLGITDPDNGFAFVNKPTLPFVVTSGDSRELTVRYTGPSRQTPQTDTSSFVVTSDEPAPGDAIDVELVADGGGAAVCDVQVNPSGFSLVGKDGTLQFGSVNIGFTKTMPIRVTNIGNTDCSLQSFRLQTQAGNQLTATGPSLPATFGPGQAAQIDVTFAPTGGTSNPLGYTSLLNYVDFTLAGPGLAKPNWSIGITAKPTVPTIDIIPGEIDFGVVTYENPQPPDNRSSCGSEERMFRIYNSGSGALSVTSIAIDASSDPVFLINRVRDASGNNVSAPYAMNIAPGQLAEVFVRFYPTRLNPAVHQGLLVVENNVTTQSTVPLRGESTSNRNQVDTFNQLSDNKVDILWVVDDSCSMSDEQTLLANNLQGFINYADSLNVDYQVGVITAEINDAVSGKLWACNGFNKIIRHTDPNRVAAFQCAVQVTNPPNGNRRPNPGGSDEAEACLGAAKIALEPPVENTDNAGFLRPDARLAVIGIADEEDQSPGPVGLYVDFFRNLKGFRNPQLVSFSAIAGDVPGGCATAAAGQRYYDAVNQLGGQFQSICASSWQTMLQNIGLGVFALRTAWTLTRLADASTIVVRVNGTLVSQDATNGWTYDANSNSVEFNGGSVPPPGATIEVRYGAICLP